MATHHHVLFLTLFFYNTYLYCLDKETYTDKDTQTRTKRIRKQLIQTNFAKDPKHKENYKETPESFTNPLLSPSSSSDIAAGEEGDLHRELERFHRTHAFVGVEVEKTVGDRPSIGASPQPHQPLDRRPPTATITAEERASKS